MAERTFGMIRCCIAERSESLHGLTTCLAFKGAHPTISAFYLLDIVIGCSLCSAWIKPIMRLGEEL